MKFIKVFPDSDSLAHAAAEFFVDLAVQSIAARGRFAVALAGGSTPGKTYSLLASEKFASRVGWQFVHVFWSDERCVPLDHKESNFRMTRKTFIQYIPLPADNIHRIRGEIEPKKAAKDYERKLQSFFIMQNKKRGTPPEEFTPNFDLILLGMGTDGHTASLFPGTAALRARRHWVVANYVEKLDAWRITLTPIIINCASHILFLVSGRSKAHSLHQVLQGSYTPWLLPSQLIKPAKGQLLWMVDEAAAALL